MSMPISKFCIGDTPSAEIENNDDDNEEKEVKENENDSGKDGTLKEESDENKTPVKETPTKEDSTNLSDFDELLFCRSPNQVKVRRLFQFKAAGEQKKSLKETL